MPTHLDYRRIKPAFKLWFEIGENYVFGEGTYNLLKRIQEEKSISKAAKASNMSYRYAWGLIKDIETHLGEPAVETQRGGKHGGKSELTDAGLSLLESYGKLRRAMSAICKLN